MNCLIIDDEKPSREELRYFIENHSSLHVLAEYENAIQALKFYQEYTDVDVVFLDINMPNLDGMELARIMQGMKVKPEIVFVTAYKEHAAEAFRVEAFDYLLKPYSSERIIGLLGKLEAHLAQSRTADESRGFADISKKRKITLANGEKIIVLNPGEIHCVKANGRKVDVHFGADKVFSAAVKFSDVEQQLDSKTFFKTHRSYIVNVERIKEIDPWFNSTYLLTVDGMEEKVPVSRHYIKEFKRTMSI